jgi:hypothetical protein
VELGRKKFRSSLPQVLKPLMRRNNLSLVWRCGDVNQCIGDGPTLYSTA